MKSLSALAYNSALELSSPDYEDRLSPRPKEFRDRKVTRQDSETDSPDIKMKHEMDSPSLSSSSSSSSSPQSSQFSPPLPQHHPPPPPLLPLTSLSDAASFFSPLPPFLAGGFARPLGTGASFLPFPLPGNGTSFLPFHPASVLLRHHQAALAYSYALLNAQHHHQHQFLQQQHKQLQKDQTPFFRPHELPEPAPHRQQRGAMNYSTEKHYFSAQSKSIPPDCNEARFNQLGVFIEKDFKNSSADQLPVDLRKGTSADDYSDRYHHNHTHPHHHHHHRHNYAQQQLALATPKKNPSSGKKLIGIRFLFPPFADHVTLYERAKIWVARHEHKYFVDWSADDLLKVAVELRPIQPITRQQYKVHMNRSEFCRNVKLKFCLQTDSPWAKEFCKKLQKSPAEGGFTGLCQAKIAAADLWRTYSENYRSHQARQPNGTSVKHAVPKNLTAKKRPLPTEDASAKKCTKLEEGKREQLAGKIDEATVSESLLNYSKLRSNNYYYYYYRQYNTYSNKNNDSKSLERKSCLENLEKRCDNDQQLLLQQHLKGDQLCLRKKCEEDSDDEVVNIEDDKVGTQDNKYQSTGSNSEDNRDDKDESSLNKRIPIWSPLGKVTFKFPGNRSDKEAINLFVSNKHIKINAIPSPSTVEAGCDYDNAGATSVDAVGSPRPSGRRESSGKTEMVREMDCPGVNMDSIKMMTGKSYNIDKHNVETGNEGKGKGLTPEDTHRPPAALHLIESFPKSLARGPLVSPPFEKVLMKKLRMDRLSHLNADSNNNYHNYNHRYNKSKSCSDDGDHKSADGRNKINDNYSNGEEDDERHKIFPNDKASTLPLPKSSETTTNRNSSRPSDSFYLPRRLGHSPIMLEGGKFKFEPMRNSFQMDQANSKEKEGSNETNESNIATAQIKTNKSFEQQQQMLSNAQRQHMLGNKPQQNNSERNYFCKIRNNVASNKMIVDNSDDEVDVVDLGEGQSGGGAGHAPKSGGREP